MKTWLSQGSRIWPQCDVTRRQRPIIVYITEKAAHQHAQNLTFGLFTAAWLFRLTGLFHIHLFLFIEATIHGCHSYRSKRKGKSYLKKLLDSERVRTEEKPIVEVAYTTRVAAIVFDLNVLPATLAETVAGFN